ncbi:MAG: ATP-binding protein [Gemmatimonadaceae bacterium]|nr:ATP-binding protein [Gemmatimonadaceae bacterium]
MGNGERAAAEPPRRRTSLRVRLLALVFIAGLPAIATVLLRARSDRATAIRRVNDQLTQLVRDAAREQQRVLSSGQAVLRAWTQVQDIVSGDRAACERAFARLRPDSSDLVFPTRVSARGILDCGGTASTSIGLDLSTEPLFDRVLTSDSTMIGEYLRSTVLPEPLVALNAKLRDPRGRVTGILSVGMRMRWVSELAERVGVTRGAVVLLVDETGLILARHPDAGLVGTVHPEGTIATSLRVGKLAGFQDARSRDSVPRRIAFARLPGPPTKRVAIGVGVPVAEVTAAADARLRQSLALLLASMAAAALVAWWAADRLILRDMRALIGAADRIGTGDFSSRSGVRDAPEEVQRLSTAIDQMARRLGEREERQLQAQKLESIGRLAGGIAHDFNNLLTAITGNVEDVRDGLPPGSPERESLDLALDATRRSGALTRQLLTFARRDALQATPMALGPVAEETAVLLRRTLGTSITVEVRSDETRLAAIDRGRVEQILVNLALNSRDAMPDGGRLVLEIADVTLREPARGVTAGDWVRLDVTDTGIGMPPAVKARLFEPFFTTKAPGQGTGLGLSMVYATMQQLGGSVTVESAPGRGTTMSLWFPAADANARPAESASATRPVRGRTVGAGRILLVEDESSVRTLAARVLRREGYTVIEADDGAAALQCIGDEGVDAFDVLITDLVMPRLGGVALTEAIRTRRPTMPVVLMSGFVGSERPQALLQLPRTVLLEKPFALTALLDAVTTVRRE